MENRCGLCIDLLITDAALAEHQAARQTGQDIRRAPDCLCGVSRWGTSGWQRKGAVASVLGRPSLDAPRTPGRYSPPSLQQQRTGLAT